VRGKPCAMYLGGVRVDCAILYGESFSEALRDAAVVGAPLAMMRSPGPAPEGWIGMVRGYAKPRPAPHEALTPLGKEHHAMMRGLYGLYAGRFPGMLTREDPEEWASRLQASAHCFGVFEVERLLLWLMERDGALLELSAAPDALPRIPGALSAAGITRAPAPLVGVPADSTDETVKLKLLRPFRLPGGPIESPEQLARALDGAVQWD
jgi:hypothetical protein